MSKKISWKKLAQMVEGSKGASSAVKSTPVAKWVVIGPRDEVPNISPSNKGKSTSDAKKKGPISPLEEKRKGSSVKALAKAKALSNKAAAGEGTSANPGAVLGPKASMLGNPTVAEKFLEGVIPPSDKEEVEKLGLDRAISRFFHGVGEVVVLASSLVGRGRELREEAIIQYARAESAGTEMARAQQRATELEGLVTELGDREQKATEELQKMEERDAIVARLETEMAELKKKAIAEFKASDEFQEAIEFIASRYFGEGFDFCKRQISRFHPDLDIQSMGIDADLLEEEEEEEEDGEEGEKEEEQEKEEGEKGDTSPLSP
ncbi:uncharacterized protein LOC130769038 isoform X2 [Actinidia eriantha]|uniref:uncharacterized protein LOC130769038 isoform X2 n=1 Tax=Actinidia eriantha TaxID=165200 RepID=UPI00258C6CAE|nr:uncharacterized protein LOC130769038 isoform X2 [Actinidia eriantha]